MKKLVPAIAVLLMCLVGLAACSAPATSGRTSYTVYFDSQGGSAAGSVQTNGNEVIVMPANPVRQGYVFDGWYTDNTDYTTRFHSNYLLYRPLTEDMTVYAKWSQPLDPSVDPGIVGYTVTYTSGDSAATGTAPTQNNVFPGDVFTVADNPYDNAGCLFVCWTDGATTYLPGSQYAAGAAAVTFTAVWDPIEYAIVYRLDGGTNAPENRASYTVRDGFALFAPTKPGYDFDGWYNNAQREGNAVTIIAAGGLGNLELFAKWVPERYTVTYALGGGENHPDNPATYSVDSGAIVLYAPTRVFYSFAGWFSDAAKTLPATGIAAGSTGNKTFYAAWTPNRYDALYYDGTYIIEDLTGSVTYGTSFALPECSVVDPLRIFVGWRYNSIIYKPGDRLVMNGAGADIEAAFVSIYDATEGLTFNDTVGRVTGYEGAASVIYVPASHGGRAIESIGNYAFAECAASDIYLPYTLSYIAPYAFYGCAARLHFPENSMLTAINDAAFFGYAGTQLMLPSGVAEIGLNAFAFCENLRSIEIPSGVRYIMSYTFAGCDSLEEIILPAELLEVGDAAFDGCAALATITVLAEVPPVMAADAFADCAPTLTVYVPQASIEAYRSAPGWATLTLVPLE